MIHYNLTFWQKVGLVFLRILWLSKDKDKRKSWHEVKKGLEKHEHKFTIPHTEVFHGRAYKFLKCNHEGCYLMDPID